MTAVSQKSTAVGLFQNISINVLDLQTFFI